MSVTNFHLVPKVPDSVAHLDPDVVVEVLSRHGVNVSDAADELGVASADLRRFLCAKPHLTDMAVELEERRLDLAEKNIYEALRSDDSRVVMRLRCSPFATAIALVNAAGSPRAPAWPSFRSAPAPLVRARSDFVGGQTRTTSATRRRPTASGCAMRASSSNTRPAQSLRTRTKILRRLRELRPTVDGLRWIACDQDAVPPFRRTDAASFHLVFIWRLLRAPLA
jgi:hypothetical protein